MRHSLYSVALVSFCCLANIPGTAAAPPCSKVDTKSMPSRVLFLLRRGQVADAIDLYERYTGAIGRPDHDLLQQMGLLLLDVGATTDCPETQLLAIFGAGVAAHDSATHVIVQGLCSRNPQIRLASINLLAQRQTDFADALVNRAINCEDILIRLQAIYLLAQKKHPSAVGQAEALMVKLPPATWFIFAEIFATIGDARSIRQLRRLMNNCDAMVRLAAIVATAEHGRDDLIPQIRQLVTHLDASQQEACALALGKLGDEGSIDKLQILACSKVAPVSLAACLSLYKLGRQEYAKHIQQMAHEGYLLAIASLGEIEGSEDLLANLCKHSNPQIQLNATLSLLQLRDARCLPTLRRFLISLNSDCAYARFSSHGKVLSAWKGIPLASLPTEAVPIALELSMKMREAALSLALELPETDFLNLADAILAQQQNDLVPATAQLLENLGSDGAVAILKKHYQKIGAPLVRNYCNLVLFRLGAEGPYADTLKNWVCSESNIDLIKFRPIVPWDMREPGDLHLLTPEETSRLFLTSVETLASRQDDHGIEVLLSLIKDGNPKNRCPLAGLLIRAIQ